MKKLLLPIFILFALPSFVLSQNVGVDVATPQQKLDVAGGIKIGNATTGVAGSLRWNGSNFQVHDGTQWITFGTGTDNDWTISGVDMYSQVSGNVGIGTTNPAYKLQVTGTSSLSSLNINGNYTLPTTDGGSGFVLTTDGSGNVTWSNPAAVGDITSVIAGDGLINGGTSGDVTLDVDPGDGIRIVSGQVAVRPTDLDNATNGLTVVSDDFAVNVDNSTLDINGDVLRVAPSGITSNEIADGTVTTDDIANGTVQSADIANGGVASVDILDGTIVPADIATAGNDQVLTTDGSGNPQWQNQNSLFSGQAGDGLVLDAPNTELDVNVDGSTIVVNSDVVEVPTGGITTTQILDETIGTADIATGGVTSDDIANGTVQSVDIANGGVASVDILDGTVAEADMESPGNDYVLTTDGSGNVSWVTQNSFNSAQAGDGLVDDGNQIDVNVDNSTIEINADILRVKAEGITANEIATGAVTTSEILDGTVLPADMDGPAAPNLVLSTNASNVVGWNDPASLTTTLEDRDSDTYISVDDGGSPDDDNIRFFNQTSESMTIDASGKVGIGTNTPERQVHVAGATGGQILATRADGNTNTGETLGELMFDSEDDTNPSSVDASAVIRGIASEDHGNSNKGGHLAFLTKNNTALSTAPATERMRITSAGNVGIGNTNPTARLQVVGSGTIGGSNLGNSWILAGTPTSGLGMDNNELYFRGNDGNFGVLGANNLNIAVNGATRIRVATNGEIRIPFLDQNADRIVMADADGDLYATSSLVGTGLGDNLGDHSATQNVDMNDFNLLDANTVQANTILDPEDGTVTVQDNLSVTGDITVQGSDIRDNSGNLRLNGEDNVYISMDYNNNDANTRAIMFGRNDEGGTTNWNELMRIQETGLVGIGTTAPDQRLDVNGSVRITTGQRNEGILMSSGGADGNAWSRIFMEENDNNNYGFSIVYNGDAANSVLNYPTNIFGISRHDNSANGAIALAIERTGDVGINTSNPTSRLHVNGQLRVQGIGSNGSNTRILTVDGNGNVRYRNAGSWAYAGQGDNLGNHTATSNLLMGDREVDRVTYLDMSDGNNYGVRFWNGSENYSIKMGNNQQDYGWVTDYSMHFNMGTTDNRGFTWGYSRTNVVASLEAETGHFRTRGVLYAENYIQTNNHFYGRSVNGQYSNIYRMGGIYFTWDSDSYGTNTQHSIRSTYGNTYGDHLTMNSYGNIRLNIDANNNGTNYFEIGNATTGTGNTRVRIDETGQAIFGNDIYLRDGSATGGDYLARIYDSNDDGIIDIYENNAMNIRLHGNGTTVFNEQGINNDFRIESDGNANMVRVDASANRVGIGLGAPTSDLTVYSGNASIRVGNDSYNQTNSGRLIFEEDISASGSGNVCGFQFWHDGNANKLYLQSGCTPQTTRMTFQRDGRIGIGTTTPAHELHVDGSGNNARITGGGSYYSDWPGGWGRGLESWDLCLASVRLSGHSYRSDIRLKKDIQDLRDNYNPLDVINQLRPVTYHWKDERLPSNLKHGFIAQEIEKVLPELIEVGTDDMQTLGVNYDDFHAILTAAIQEQQKEIEAQRTEIEELKSLVKQLLDRK